MDRSSILSERNRKAADGIRRRLTKLTKSLKPDCLWCGTENCSDQYQGRHTPFSIYICKTCKRYFSITFSLADGRIVKVIRGSV